MTEALDKDRSRTKAFNMMFENAPNPPVGKAFVNEINTIAHTVGSVNASTDIFGSARRFKYYDYFDLPA